MKIFLFLAMEQSKNFLRCAATLALAGCFGYCVFMLSVLIETRNQEDALARTLASLVGGAIEGVVREVIVCDAGSCERTHRVAEHAGCHYLPDARALAGAQKARSDWLLLLEPGARLLDGWIDAVVAHADGAAGAARFTRARQSRASLYERFLSRRRPLAEGLIITKTQALALARGDGSAGVIARSVSSRRLGAEILTAPAQAGV